MAEEGNSTASNFIWALALIIIVALIVGALYYGGVFGGKKSVPDKVDINVSTPSR